MIISLFETVRLSVSISPGNLYNSLKSIKENQISHLLVFLNCFFVTQKGNGFVLGTRGLMSQKDRTFLKNHFSSKNKWVLFLQTCMDIAIDQMKAL